MLRLTKRRDSSWFQAGDKFALSVLWRVRVRVKLEGREPDSLRKVRGGRNCLSPLFLPLQASVGEPGELGPDV